MKTKLACLTKTARVIFVAMLAVFVAACGATRPAEPWKCALVGAGIGGTGGVAVGASINDDDSDTTDNALIGAGAGIAAGALIGYTVCGLMPEAAPLPPPPAVKAAPVVKKTLVLPGVNFAFNRADVLPAAKSTLDAEIVPELKADPSLTVLVEGHTDSVGSDAYNDALSLRRADTVKQFLVAEGISPARIETRGYGKSRPVADNSTAIGREQNRRVEVKELQ